MRFDLPGTCTGASRLDSMCGSRTGSVRIIFGVQIQIQIQIQVQSQLHKYEYNYKYTNTSRCGSMRGSGRTIFSHKSNTS